MTTREKIIYESLNLFSKKGFDAISVRDIAKAVGIRASSIYNHFKNKQDILDTIIERYSERVTKFFRRIESNSLSKLSSSNDKANQASGEEFIKGSSEIFKFYLEDEYMIKLRRLLTIEQYSNLRLANLYNKIFINDVLDFQMKVFTELMNANIFVKRDPYTLALQFYSPVFLLFYKLENITNKERVSLENHISEFKNVYITKG
ncbi:TetR/AcrR family transcriptional regulator [Clostridium sp.]|uniref:TetR/AcrR family transcriptional regulator n=1 Tax=Clostridium sp. TaxID=1506 RepID=UPI00260D2FE4|nr:TetR/AcrR family transcriptional regulator [Clostridium sp.]